MNEYFLALKPSSNPIDSLERFYKDAGLEKTWDHVTAVAKEARALAAHHDADLDAATLAALGHDLAAGVPVDRMLNVAEGMDIQVTDADRAIPIVLHGPIAAQALFTKLQIHNNDVLNAVRYHTTLRARASTLEKIIFLADKIAYDPTSPHQGDYLPGIQAAQSLDEASLLYLDFLLDNAWRYKWYPHPNALAAYRELVRKAPR